MVGHAALAADFLLFVFCEEHRFCGWGAGILWGSEEDGVLDVGGDDGEVEGVGVGDVEGVVVGSCQETFVPPFYIGRGGDEVGFLSGFFDGLFARFFLHTQTHLFQLLLLAEGICLGDELSLLVKQQGARFAGLCGGGEAGVVGWVGLASCTDVPRVLGLFKIGVRLWLGCVLRLGAALSGSGGGVWLLEQRRMYTDIEAAS